MAKHLLYFQQVTKNLSILTNNIYIKAGLTSLEVKFDHHLWQWEEELTKVSLEEVGLGIYRIIIQTNIKMIYICFLQL